MLMAIIYAFIITIFIGFIIENFKIGYHLRRTNFINLKIESIISDIFMGKENFDIFTVNYLRKVFNEEFLHTKMIDKYELYKIDDFKIKIRYFKGYVIEELEILVIEGGVELIEVNKKIMEWEYNLNV